VQRLRVRDRSRIDIEIYERGAGYTLASGSSSCAAASAARALGLVGDEVEVRMPGGRIDVAFAADGSIRMTGVAEQVATGDFAPAFRARLAAAGALPAPEPAPEPVPEPAPEPARPAAAGG
jgi:diaminopimelate epimerase